MAVNLGRYSKFVTAILGQVLTFVVAYYGGNASGHWVTAVVAAAAALGVYAVPNTKPPVP